MYKGFFDSCNITDNNSICYWLLLPVSFLMYLWDRIS